MSFQEVLEVLERKRTLSMNSRACVRVQRTSVNEEELRSECERRNIPIRVELGMLVIG